MAVFEVLAEMVGAVEFFGLIAFAKFMHFGQVFDPAILGWLGMICKLFSIISADVMGRAGRGMCRRQGRRVKGGLKSGNRGTRPRMASQVEGVLMAFCLVFVFETVVAELASVLLLHLMGSVPPCEVSQA